MNVSLVAGLVAAGVLAGGSVPAAEMLPRGIRWQTDVGSAQRVAQQTHRPLLFVFGASWCTWCRKLEQTTLSDARLDNYINANFVPVHVDADRDPQLVQRLHADSLPTSVILGSNSELLGRISGYKDVGGYQSALATAVGRMPSAPPPMNVLVQRQPVARAFDEARSVVSGAPYHKVYPSYPQFRLAERAPSPMLAAAMPSAVPANQIPGLAPANHTALQMRGVVPAPPKPAPFPRWSPGSTPMHSTQGS